MPKFQSLACALLLVTVAIAVGGVLTLVAGFGALAWGRRGAFASVDSPALVDSTGGMVPGGAHPR